MSIDNEWDINKYRTKFESEEHWILKREFILAHKDNINEGRLICLAQVFVNIRLLRCVYPLPLMRQIEELGKGIGQTFKEKQQSRLQRTFVSATDAVISKIQNSNSRSGNEQKRPGLGSISDPANGLICTRVKKEQLNLNNFVPATEKPQDVKTESDLVPPKIENDDEEEEEEENESELPNLPNKLLFRLGPISTNKSDSDPSPRPSGSIISRQALGLAINDIRGPTKKFENAVQFLLKNVIGRLDSKNIFPEDLSRSQVKYIRKMAKQFEKGWFDDTLRTLDASTQTSDVATQNGNTALEEYCNCCLRKRRPSSEGGSNEGRKRICAPGDVDQTASSSSLRNIILPPMNSSQEPTYLSQDQQLLIASKCQETLEDRSVFLVHRKYLVVEPVWQFLQFCMKFSNVPLKVINEKPSHISEYKIYAKMGQNCNFVCIGNSTASTKKMANEAATVFAIQGLLKSCYTIRILNRFDEPEELSMEELLNYSGTSDEIGTNSKPNIGASLMRMMGWSGGGLGKNKDGIVDPIEASKQGKNRRGLGIEAKSLADQMHSAEYVTSDFKTSVKALLNDLRNGLKKDLIFPKSLSNEQRKYIHQETRKMAKCDLDTKSFGNEHNRYLTVRRRLTPSLVLDTIVRNGGFSEIFELHPPGSLTLKDFNNLSYDHSIEV